MTASPVLAHTPAPWTVNVVTVQHNDGTSSIAYVKADTGHREIAVLYDPIEQVANAHLIAAAPELFAALKMICDSGINVADALEAAMLAAIAKAERRS